MKKTDLDLRALDNADDETAERISEKYTHISESDMERIFKNSRKKYLNGTEEISDKTETGENVVIPQVKHHRKSFLRSISAAAAVLAAGGAAVYGSIYILNHGAADFIPAVRPEQVSESCKVTLGDMYKFYDDEIRICTSAFVPYIIKVPDEERQRLFDVMNSVEWEEADSEYVPDGEYSTVFVCNNGNPYSLKVYPEVLVYSGETEAVYRTDSSISECIYSISENTDRNRDLVWYLYDSITNEGIWESRITVPDSELKMFEKPEIPEDLRDKEIQKAGGIYCYDVIPYEMSNITEQADRIVLGYVEDHYYTVEHNQNGSSTPMTHLTVKTVDGETTDLVLYGEGYISYRDDMWDIIGKTGDKYGDAKSDKEIDKLYYFYGYYDGSDSTRESEELPVPGQLYAFMVSEYMGMDTICSDLCGILCKSGDDFVQKICDEYRHYSLFELQQMVNNNNNKNSSDVSAAASPADFLQVDLPYFEPEESGETVEYTVDEDGVRVFPLN